MEQSLWPYQCSLCGSKFNEIDKLQQHTCNSGSSSSDKRAVKRPREYRPRAGPRAMQACRACAASKTKCDNDQHCRRCRKRNTPCIRPTDMVDQEYHGVRNTESLVSSSAEDMGGALNMELGPSPNTSTPPLTERSDQQHHGESDLGNPRDSSDAAGKERDSSEMNTHPPAPSLRTRVYGTSEDVIPFDEEALVVPTKHASHGQHSISPVISRDKSQRVTDAFKKTTGRWTPTVCNFQEDEEKNLSATQGTNITADDSLSPSDAQLLLPDGVPLAVRDRLLAMLVSSSDSKDKPRIPAAFPTCEALGQLFRSFVAWHANQDDTWIHIPTFNIDEAKIELVAAMIAGGAVRSSSRAVQKFGLAIHEMLSIWIWETMLRGGGRYRKSSYSIVSPSSDEHGSSIDERWRNWVEQESFTRLAYHVHIHSGEESLMTSLSGPLSCTEITVELPKARSLWFARSASAWKDMFQPHLSKQRPHISLVDCLADLSHFSRLPSVYDANLARVAIIHGISTTIRAYQQSHMITAARAGAKSRDIILLEDSQHRWLHGALNSLGQQFKLYPPGMEPSITALLMLELASLHAYVSIDQIELLAGKEGFAEAQVAFSLLQTQWVDSQEARQALWRAGQILRLVRCIPVETMSDTICVSVYHVSLCFWAYGTILARKAADGRNNERQSRDLGSASEDYNVVLDQEETMETQRWITLGHGRPVVAGCKSAGRQPLVAIGSTEALMQMCIMTVRSRFPFRVVLPPATETLCNLMDTLGATSSRTGGA